MMWQRLATTAFALEALLHAAASCSAGPFLLTDTTFGLANYSQVAFLDNSAVTISTSQTLTGGIPGEALQIVADVPPFNVFGSMQGFVNTSFVYDPAAQGALSTVDASVDKVFNTNLDLILNVFRPLIRQGGNYYTASIPLPTTKNVWVMGSQDGLVASDFELFDFATDSFDANQHPNFAGGVMEFGIANRLFQQLSESPSQVDIRYDNLTLQLNPAPQLQAGDADQDLDFDQLDLVRVQVAAKYLSGQSASWGEGDWNGAPGGQQGNPPQGNGFFDQMDIIAALAPAHYLTGPYAALRQGGAEGDAQTSIIYDASTGQVSVDAPAGVQLTSVNIDSAGGIFIGDPALNLGGSFDNDADNNIFKATFGSSFGSISFGNVAQTGLSEAFVANDLIVVGSLAGGGDLGTVDLVYIPEPSAGLLLGLGLLALAAKRPRPV